MKACDESIELMLRVTRQQNLVGTLSRKVLRAYSEIEADAMRQRIHLLSQSLRANIAEWDEHMYLCLECNPK